MRSRWWLASIACLATMVSPASAQSLPETVFDDLRHAVTDMLAVWAAPFRGDARDYATTALILGGTGVAAVYDDELAAWVRNHPEAGVLEVFKPFREVDHKPRLVDLGAGRSIHEISAVFYVAGLIAGSDGLRDAAVGCVAAEKANGILRNYIYKGVSRERPLFQEVVGSDTITRPGRPYDIRFPSRDPWWDNSFFGGHGANVLSCVSFLNYRFELGLIEPVLWTVGLGVNFGRIADERHWLSDSILGAAFGIAIGKYVAERSLERKAERRGDIADEADATSGRIRGSLLDGLYLGPYGGGIAIGWRRRF